MSFLKSKLSSNLRNWGILMLADKARFIFYKAWRWQKNERFRKQHPGIKLPPPYLVYESYRMDYEAYYQDGLDSAKEIVGELSIFTAFNSLNILDWGCGPARIVRHLPLLLDESNRIYATDYNEQTIQWCRKNIPGVHFYTNAVSPPTVFDDSFFDAIYGISIFTHLSREKHTLWMNELYRVLKPGGLLLITTQGSAFRNILTDTERKHFDEGLSVERAGVKEGHRMFSAFQPEGFMRSLVSGNWNVLKFKEGSVQDWGAEQDTWILKKELRKS